MAGPTTPREFQRQLRSVFAILRTLVRQTKEGRQSIEDYAAHLEGRIGALARVQEILLRAPDEGADLYELVCGELISQAIPQSRFDARGPEVRITQESAAALTLTFHELTVNAMTHGALATSEGHVRIRWSLRTENGRRWLDLAWDELNGAPPGDITRKQGFGTELLERMLPYELGARPARTCAEDGIRIRLQIPAAAGGLIWRSANGETL